MLLRTCKAKNDKGQPCGATPLRDRDFCVFHDPEHEETIQAARSAGGQRRKREATLATAYDFEGLRSKLYAIRPDWKAQGLLDGGVGDLDKIQRGLTKKFLSTEPDEHITKLEGLAMPFRFDTLGAATPLTREEFIAEQTEHAKRLRLAILADASAPSTLGVLAADEAQWVQGWLAALETAGLLRPSDEAPPIRQDGKIVSLNATLATGILLSKGGESYRTQGDLLGFFAKVQQWYGDTARWAGDPQARQAQVDYAEARKTEDGGVVLVPVPVAPERRITESRKNPPPHIESSSEFPDEMRTSDDFCRSSIAERGIATIPCFAMMVNGYSPF